MLQLQTRHYSQSFQITLRTIKSRSIADLQHTAVVRWRQEHSLSELYKLTLSTSKFPAKSSALSLVFELLFLPTVVIAAPPEGLIGLQLIAVKLVPTPYLLYSGTALSHSATSITQISS